MALLPLLFPAYLGETPEDKPMRTPRPQGQFSGRRRDECEGVAKTRTKTPSPHIHRALRPPLTRTDNISPERQPALSPLPGAPCPWPRVQSCAAAHSPSRQHQTWRAVLGRQPSPLQAPGRWEGPVGGAGGRGQPCGRGRQDLSQLRAGLPRKAPCSALLRQKGLLFPNQRGRLGQG